MGKTVLASKFTEWKGLDRISAIVHEMKCIFREITKDDYGLDGEIEVVRPKADGQGYETTGGIIKVQAKSGESYVKQDTDESFITARSAPPRTVAKYYEYGHARFWRHLAVNLTFRRIGTSWFLQVIPKYFFTQDGETP